MDAQPDGRAAQRSEGEAVGPGRAEHLIRRSASAAAFDKFDDDGRIARDIFAQIGDDGFNACPGRAAGIVVDDPHRLALIEWSLGKNQARRKSEPQQHGDQEQVRIFLSHWNLLMTGRGGCRSNVSWWALAEKLGHDLFRQWRTQIKKHNERA